MRNILSTLLLCCLATGLPGAARSDGAVVRNLIEKGDFRAAMALVDAALETRPDDPAMLLHRGFLLVSLSRLEAAEALYREMKVSHPDMPEPGNNLAIVYRNQDRMHAALLELAQVIEAFPLFEQAHDNLREICGDVMELTDSMPKANSFCEAFDHDAATAARKAARDALPLVVEKDQVVEVIALRPVEFTSAPLDDGDPAETSIVGSDEPDTGLRRELDDLAGEFESFRGRMETALNTATAARDEADAEADRLAAENSDLQQQVAAFESQVMDLEQQLQQSEQNNQESVRSRDDADAALTAMEASVSAAREGRQTAEQRVAELESELSVSREALQQAEVREAALEADIQGVRQELATALTRLESEQAARNAAEQSLNDLNRQLAALQDQVGSNDTRETPAAAAAEVTGTESEDDPADGELSPADSMVVAGAAEARIDEPGVMESVAEPETATEAVATGTRFEQWKQPFEAAARDGGYLAPPDHIRWQVEHVVNGWFDTYARGDVDGHLALYSSRFAGFIGPRLTEWLAHRFEGRSAEAELDPALNYLRQTAADSVEVFLPDFNTLPGATGGQVMSLTLRYRHGRWQIVAESTNADQEASTSAATDS